VWQCVAVCGSVWQCVAVCCSVLQCVAVCCSVLQCVAVCCSVSTAAVSWVLSMFVEWYARMHSHTHVVHKSAFTHTECDSNDVLVLSMFVEWYAKMHSHTQNMIQPNKRCECIFKHTHCVNQSVCVSVYSCIPLDVV